MAKTHVDSITFQRDHETDKISVIAKFSIHDKNGDRIDYEMVELDKKELAAMPEGVSKDMRDFATNLHYILDKKLVEDSGAFSFNKNNDLDAIFKKVNKAEESASEGSFISRFLSK